MLIDSKAATRFWAKVGDRSDDSACWNWRASVTDKGYGQFWIATAGRCVPAHRVSYEISVAQIPAGMTLDHLCRNRACVNPSHLEPVTNSENVRRGEVGSNKRAQTHCINGHPFDSANTYIRPESGRPGRECISCRRNRAMSRRIG